LVDFGRQGHDKVDLGSFGSSRRAIHEWSDGWRLADPRHPMVLRNRGARLRSGGAVEKSVTRGFGLNLSSRSRVTERHDDLGFGAGRRAKRFAEALVGCSRCEVGACSDRVVERRTSVPGRYRASPYKSRPAHFGGRVGNVFVGGLRADDNSKPTATQHAKAFGLERGA